MRTHDRNDKIQRKKDTFHTDIKSKRSAVVTGGPQPFYSLRDDKNIQPGAVGTHLAVSILIGIYDMIGVQRL